MSSTTWTVRIELHEKPGVITARAVLEAGATTVTGEAQASSFTHGSATAQSVAARRALDDLATHMHYRFEGAHLAHVDQA